MESERLNGGYEYHPDLLPYLQRTIVGFALKKYSQSREDRLLWKEKIGALLKSWMFDLDPMTWIHVRELTRFANIERVGFFTRTPLEIEAQSALRTASLFPEYMETRPTLEIEHTRLSAAVVNVHIPEFKPFGGIFERENMSDLIMHLRIARNAGLL